MEIAFACPECGEKNRASAVEDSSVLNCGRCSYLGLHGNEWAREGRVHSCPICGSAELFRQREYQQKLVIVVLLLGTVLALPTRFLSLALALLVTAVHCVRAAEKLVCYGCGSEIHGHHPRGQFSPYDPAVASRIESISDRGRSNSPKSLP